MKPMLEMQSTDWLRINPLKLADLVASGFWLLLSVFSLILPLSCLIHPSGWQRTVGFWHSLGASLALLGCIYLCRLALALLRGHVDAPAKARTALFWVSIILGIAILSGCWALMRYSAPVEGSARTYLIVSAPLAHYVLMNWHQFTLLFTFPMAFGACYTLYQYGDEILQDRYRLILVAVSLTMLLLVFFCGAGFMTGLAISRFHSL